MVISVVTIVYNDCDHIEQTLNSVFLQTVREQIEYIVIDGCSTDGTSSIIASKSKNIDCYICEEDSGIYNAMNKGLEKATGDYVLFLNSGDVFSSLDVVEKTIALIPLDVDSRPVLIYGNYRIKEEGYKLRVIPSRSYDMIWYGPVASHQSTFYNMDFIRDNNLKYDESYIIAADYKLTLQVIKKAKGRILRIPICVSDFDSNGISSCNQNVGLKEANRVRREVLEWGGGKEIGLTFFLILARIFRKYGGVIYRNLRGYEFK